MDAGGRYNYASGRWDRFHCTWISTRISLARTLYAHAISENTHAPNRTRDSQMASHNCGNFRISQSRLLKGTNCLFASKNHVRPLSKRLCIIFIACSCPNFVLYRSFKDEEEKDEDGENRAVFPFTVYYSSDVF